MIAKLKVLRPLPSLAVVVCVTATAVTTMAAVQHASAEHDCAAVWSLDAAYYAAVKTNDVATMETMERLLADVATGAGKTFTKQIC